MKVGVKPNQTTAKKLGVLPLLFVHAVPYVFIEKSGMMGGFLKKLTFLV